LPAGKSLGDYGSVTFKWKAEGFKDDGDNVTSNKRLYLLATDDEALVTAPQHDTIDTIQNAVIKSTVVSSTWFDGDGASHTFFSEDASNCAMVNGENLLQVTLPIVKGSYYIGEVWFAIYVHANTGKYTISDFQLVAGEYTGAPVATGDKTDAPSLPVVVVPGAAKSFDLNLMNFGTVSGVSGGVATPADAGSGAINVAFTASGERLIIVLTDEQYGIVNSRVDNRVIMNLDAEIVSGDQDAEGNYTSDNFRYHIGNAAEGGQWNTTNPGIGDGALASIIGVKDDKQLNEDSKLNNAIYSSRPVHFILQHRSGGNITIKISKITITVYVGDNAPDAFLNATGLQKVAQADPDIVSVFGGGTHSFDHSVLTVNGNGGFAVTLPADVTASDTVTITYSAYLATGTELKLVRKQYKSGNEGWPIDDITGVVDPYPSLVSTGAPSTITVDLSKFSAEAVGETVKKAYFQTNGSYEAKIKIISVVKDEPLTFDTAVGMTTGIGAQGSATFADGIISMTAGSSALFTVAAPGATSTSTIKIKYICEVTTGEPKIILKNGGWTTDILVGNTAESNWYPTLTADVESTLTVKGSWYTTPTTGIWFQRNGDSNFFKIKIISVTVE